MPVLGRCSNCGYLHYQPFGKRCKVKKGLVVEVDDIPGKVKMTCIPGSGFEDRDDPNYTVWLEQQYKKQLEALQADNAGDEDGDNKVLANILQRLDKLETRGVDAGGMGAQRHQHGPVPGRDVPSASEFSSLTDSIKNLSLAVDSGRDTTSKQGIELRPEFHVQIKVKGLSANSMNPFTLRSEELLHGMLNVFMFLEEKGLDSKGYLAHFKFVSRHVMERHFTTLACVKYNKYVVDEVLAGRAKFGDINPVAAGLFLHGGAVMIRDKQRNDRSGMVNTTNSRQGSEFTRTAVDPRQQNVGRLRDCNKENVPYTMPENWPSEVCFNYNVRSCMGKCLKLHVCSHCNLRHRLSDCKFASKEAGDRNQFHSQQNAYW